MNSAFYRDYAARMSSLLRDHDFASIHQLTLALKSAWEEGKRVYICGNGGSAANAMHLANDLMYGIAKKGGKGLRVTALTADSSVMTCIANDVSYEEVFSSQLAVLGQPNDILIALSGSGNSKNIVSAIRVAKELRMKTFAMLGYGGGQCLKLVDVPIHFPIDDMQIAEDMQLMAGHMVMRWLSDHPVGAAPNAS